ncbi:type I secretion system permease/ATPase [Marinovum sp. 2_MG-2023]|uniref:type I secretion system permease/ATPase n=1 Tax=unclassified Marinovum TaxID=2647166 RepID=UPI0026E2C129|nr:MULTISPECIES: type I secretion system permease/ATPase [unclassified Marinovum]MDO6729685.1 type I secretion system permease/ATPase [Marinovum sp. 2_MG-2023]MDO6779499.1 type I secretion system permease/ATPase [Marinovum sp. 1_MG-2023]
MDPILAGQSELRAVRRESRGLYWCVGVFSFFANILMLTGPLYMLQVYDRVLSSRSEATLLALTVLVIFLYTVMGVLDYVRGRIMARVGARFQSRLDDRVFDASLRASALRPDDAAATGLRDLESVQRFLTSPVLLSLFDLPWTPLFLFGIAIFHPWLGILAVSGGALLVAIAITSQQMQKRPVFEHGVASHKSESIAARLRSEAEMVQAMGMRKAALHRWKGARLATLGGQLRSSDVSGGFTALTRALRLLLQSAMLGMGALLVLRGEMSPGAMIAGSILLGRALAPIEVIIGQWSVAQRARQGWRSLARLLGSVPEQAPKMDLPIPRAKLEVQQLTIIPPQERQAALRMISFDVNPGQAVGVIGPSGAGKSSLASAITGLWPPTSGRIRLDGATLDQYDPEKLGQYIGYLPQKVELFDGTIAENIARLAPEPDAEMVVVAAKMANAHEMILKFPEGYDTRIEAHSAKLSGGQMQRIGLARALYGNPVFVVLDEPNSNLDNEGSAAVNSAIRAVKDRGGAVLIMAHRPAAIQECDTLLVLDEGARVAFGPRDEVLKKTVQNAAQLRRPGTGGVQ